MAGNARHLEAQSAEQAVLGGILLDNTALDRVAALLRPDDFAAPRHRLVYERMLALAEARMPIDVVTVGSALEQQGDLENAGGLDYIVALFESVLTAVNLEHHAHIVHDKAEVRRLIGACVGIIEKANSGEYDETGRLIDEAQQLVYEIGQQKSARGFVPLSNALKAAIDKVKEAYATKLAVTGLPTGFVELDAMTAGLQAGDLIILGARPAMGKTSFALNLATNAAFRSGKAVAVFSLEMPTVQLVTRMLSSEARVASTAMRTGHMDGGDVAKVIEAVNRMSGWRVQLDDTPGLTVMEARSKCRRLAADKSAGELGMIVIDYLQLMRGSPNPQSREQEISEISRGLKGLAKELNVPVVALSQLSRSLESRPNKRPINSDLRESGAIEQDADIIMFIYRDEYYHPDTEDQGIAEVIIAKHRNGPVGTVKLRFFNEWTRFENLAAEG
ncbi:replicative DNA helicase [Myxococcota bacterium]|nr:replicative DNA helicase [Myxococcota bacterium]